MRVAKGDEYSRLAPLLAKPLYTSVEEARAGQSDEAVIQRWERAWQELNSARSPAKETNAVCVRAYERLEASHVTLAAIQEIRGDTPDVIGLLGTAMRASPAMLRGVQQQPALDGDRQAIQILLAKGMTEAVTAGANQWRLAQEWRDYRDHHANIHKISLELAPLAKRRPCLYGMGMSYTVTDDGARSSIVIDGLAPGGPAATAGIRQGDSIVGVDENPVVLAGKLNGLAIALLEPNARDSKVRLRIVRGTKTLEIVVTRQHRLDDTPGLLSLRLRGSCDGAFDGDVLALTNTSGMDLSDCAILTTLQSATGNDSHPQHLHFMAHWPRDKTLFAIYHNARSPRIASNDSPRMVAKVSAEVYSNEFQGAVRYSYWNSQDRHDDMKRYCATNMRLSGKFLAATDGLLAKGDGLYQQDAAVRLWLLPVDGRPVPRLAPRQISVQLQKGRRHISADWEETELSGGGVGFKTFSSPAFNGFGEPDSIEVRLRFYGTDYVHVVSFKP
jgi:hypothetical protein